MDRERTLDDETLITPTSDIAAAYVSNNKLAVAEVAQLIATIHDALARLGGTTVEEPLPAPAVAIRSSVKNDHIVCLEDGRKLKTLKRHLMSEHGLTPAQYRSRWGLGPDYPMVASDYGEKRRGLAKKIGLGRRPGGGKEA
jgi:predicted transcriptional regulator